MSGSESRYGDGFVLWSGEMLKLPSNFNPPSEEGYPLVVDPEAPKEYVERLVEAMASCDYGWAVTRHIRELGYSSITREIVLKPREDIDYLWAKHSRAALALLAYQKLVDLSKLEWPASLNVLIRMAKVLKDARSWWAIRSSFYLLVRYGVLSKVDRALYEPRDLCKLVYFLTWEPHRWGGSRSKRGSKAVIVIHEGRGIPVDEYNLLKKAERKGILPFELIERWGREHE